MSIELFGEGKRPKISKDKNGNRYVRHGKKKITAPSDISDTDFLKWLIKYLKPRRKKKEPTKAAKGKPPMMQPIMPTHDYLDLSSAQASDEGVRNYVNIERERAGRDKLDAPVGPGLPVTVDRDVLEKREARRLARLEREAELVEVKREAAATGAMLLVESKDKALQKLGEKYVGVQDALHLNVLVKRVLGSEDSKVYGQYTRMPKMEKIAWLLSKGEPEISFTYDNLLAAENLRLFGKGVAPGITSDQPTNASTREGMSTDDINKVMAPYRPHYLGTIARNEWELLAPASHNGKSAWIMNTDPNTRGGTHWVAFLMDLDHHTMEYYNSFGDDIPVDILTTLKGFIEKSNPTKQYLKLKVNRVVDQAATSDNCGWFCCKFIIDRFRGKPWKEVTKFDDHVHGEKDVEAFKKQHGGAYSVYL